MSHVSIGRRVQHASVAHQAAGWLRAAWQAWQNRVAARQLQRLDDRLLADIGLRRADVERAFAVPLWQDPTRELASIVTERRRARRRWM